MGEAIALQEQLAAFQSAVDSLPFAMFWKDRALRYLGSNQQFATYAGVARPAALRGRLDQELPWKPEESLAFQADDREVIRTGNAKLGIIEPQRHADGRERWVETNKLPLRNVAGEIIGVVGWYGDITERKLAEDQQRNKDTMIQQQAEELFALATPLLPVAEGVIVMPLIGRIDEARAQQVVETLLTGVTQHRARAAILDVTGVQRVDAGVVRALVHAAQGVRLLGATAIVTGIRPDVAQVMVQLGADMRHLMMLNDLKSGIAYALGR